MIFAELQYDQHYSDIHNSLVEYLEAKISTVESGLQGDSWIWVFRGEQKVAIDTFASMKHQVKSDAASGEFAREVVRLLSDRFSLTVFAQPEIEPHED